MNTAGGGEPRFWSGNEGSGAEEGTRDSGLGIRGERGPPMRSDEDCAGGVNRDWGLGTKVPVSL